MSSFTGYQNAPSQEVEQNRANQDQQDTDRPHAGGTKKIRLKISQRLRYTGILAFVSFTLLLIAFASPYWLSSYKYTYSAFKRLGLWDFCFDNYRHPSYQYDARFTGCHWIYSSVYTNIRDWLQPGWFIFVQTMMTLALCISALALISISFIFMHFLIRFQMAIMIGVCLAHLFAAILTLFACTTFFIMAFDRSWLQYPNFNHLDWAYFLAILSMFGNAAAFVQYYREVRTIRERSLKLRRLVVGAASRSDMDSIDAVYAAQSNNSYNPDTPTTERPMLPRFTQV